MRCPKFSVPVTPTVASVLLAIVSAIPAQAQDYTLTLDGAPISERLDATDDYLVEDNSYIDTYTFTGTAGQRVIITMSSQELDSYLILLDPDGNSVAQDDDSADDLDARIDVILPVDGTYTIYANSYGSNAIGAYTIQAATVADTPVSPVSEENIAPTPNHNLSDAPQSRYFCEDSGNVPLTMARSRRTNSTFPQISCSNLAMR